MLLVIKIFENYATVTNWLTLYLKSNIESQLKKNLVQNIKKYNVQVVLTAITSKYILSTT